MMQSSPAYPQFLPLQSLYVFLDGVSVFVHYVNIISTEQKFMCSIQWKSFLIFLVLPSLRHILK